MMILPFTSSFPVWTMEKAGDTNSAGMAGKSSFADGHTARDSPQQRFSGGPGSGRHGNGAGQPPAGTAMAQEPWEKRAARVISPEDS